MTKTKSRPIILRLVQRQTICKKKNTKLASLKLKYNQGKENIKIFKYIF